MEQYTNVSYETARNVTRKYSTSFSKSSELFDSSIRKHIYAIYGFVRIADEIVDTYRGPDTEQLLKALEVQAYAALKTGFSPNPLVHAFVTTAREFNIGRDLIKPFFKSMHMDITTYGHIQNSYKTHTKSIQDTYKMYIYGSAEVVGLMCLKVFCNDEKQYKKLENGAKALGAAYQKVNFLRDIKSDYEERGRVYFPGVSYESFNEKDKEKIITDIKNDFKKAKPAVDKLPENSQKAVALSFAYYNELLNKLANTPAFKIKETRIRVSAPKKLQLLVKNRFTRENK